MARVVSPSRLLNNGERVLVSTRTHPKALVVPLVLLHRPDGGHGRRYDRDDRESGRRADDGT